MIYPNSSVDGVKGPAAAAAKKKASGRPRCLFFFFVPVVMLCLWDFEGFFFFLHDSFGSYGTLAFKNVLSFVVKRGASEHCSRRRIYLLSVRMNKAFHHLAAVLEWAPNETPPSLAPRSLVQGGSSSFTLVLNLSLSLFFLIYDFLLLRH